MVSEKTKGNFGAIVIMSFIVGVFFMIIDEGIGIVFGIGLLLFFFALIVGITVVMWSIAGSAERMTRRF
jgi:Flp pilus assembly protein TadB